MIMRGGGIRSAKKNKKNEWEVGARKRRKERKSRIDKGRVGGVDEQVNVDAW